MTPRLRLRLLISAFCLLPSAFVTVSARVISYAPYTDRGAIPALQHRLNRYFVLVESSGTTGGGTPPPIMAPVPYNPGVYGQVVLYDAWGLEEPRVIYPQDGTQAWISAAAVREALVHNSAILIQTRVDEPTPHYEFRLSTDSGTTWKPVDVPVQQPIAQLFSWQADVGGPFARGRRSQIRIGTEANPFAVASGDTLYAIGADGSWRVLYSGPNSIQLIGSDKEGARLLVRTLDELLVVDATQHFRYATVATSAPLEGWITPEGGVYIERNNGSSVVISYLTPATKTDLITVQNSNRAFAIPTADHRGAWILERGPGRPTALYRHLNGELAKQWEDFTAPEVEALHAGASGNKLLIQVHRPRPQADQRIFLDPALAVWTVGQPAPRAYDELFMNEQPTKGFVHLDVDKLEAGEPFVFDSGITSGVSNIISPAPAPPSSGGGDVIQEWGVVRASLKQRLVLPGVGRTGGLHGSYWVTDLIAYNPLDEPQQITMRFVFNGESPLISALNERTITLGKREIRFIGDVLQSEFGIEVGVGALFITPEHGANVTSRTYSRSESGTYGYSMNAIDFYAAAASPRFPVSFSGALPGPNFRTNMILTDTSGRGTEASIIASGTFGPMGRSDAAFSAVANGQRQLNGLSGYLGLEPFEFGALLVRPTRGTAIASLFAVDNRTNDATYFPPDLPSPVVRTIPVIGHIEGANGSRFRSDLYLYNPASQVRTVILQVKMWDAADMPRTINLTLLPHEAKIIPDVLFTAFGKTGLARLRYQSSGDAQGVRVTSRTYTIDPNGGTYGFLMPPLNNFQAGTSGDTLEILGAFADPDYRTNIGLVELTAFPNGQNARVKLEIIDNSGTTADSFEVNVPIAGGMQLNDIVRARAMNVTGPFLIRVSPLNGAVGAYAAITDNRTNDSAYLAANLAASQ
jgi:hypothetical protein